MATVAALMTGSLVAGCAIGGPDKGRGPAEVVEYRVDGGSVVLTIDTCNGEPEITSLGQGVERVEVAVTCTSHDPGDGCLDLLSVDLESPLGDRDLVDLSTGRVVDRID